MEKATKQLITTNKNAGYEYCKKHDSFFNAELQKERDTAVAKLECDDEIERMMFSLSMHACPSCNAGVKESLYATMGLPEEQRQYDNFQEGNILMEIAIEREKQK